MKLNKYLFLSLVFLAGHAEAYNTATLERALDDGVSISAADGFACALTEDKRVFCWGRNKYHQTNIPKLSNPTQVSAGGDHACALHDWGVKCWGSNRFGQTDVPKLTNPTQVSAGGNHACALDDLGVKCWGFNYYRQTTIPKLSNPTQVSAGRTHACALDDSGVKCWGDNDFYQVSVPKLRNPTLLSVGSDHNCALDDSGVTCWGGGGEYSQANIPKLTNPTQISAGGYHNTCALDNSGVVCWGNHGEGDTQVPKLTNPTQVSAGDYYTCVVDDLGVKCWGRNNYGQSSPPNELKKYLYFLRFDEFDIYSLENAFLQLSDNIYSYKASFFRKLATDLKQFPIDKENALGVQLSSVNARTFILNAISSVLYDIQSPYVESKVLPKVTKTTEALNAKLGISGFYELELKETTLDVSLSLIRYALESTRAYIGTKDNTEQLELLIVKIGKLSAGTLSLSEKLEVLNKALSGSKSLISTLVDNSRTHGFGVMVSAIGQYLNQKGSNR